MHIAVTGGTGYVGAHIVAELLAAGHDVKLLVEPQWSNDALLAHLRGAGTLELVRGDLRTPTRWPGCSTAVTRCCTAPGWWAPTTAARR